MNLMRLLLYSLNSRLPKVYRNLSPYATSPASKHLFYDPHTKQRILLGFRSQYIFFTFIPPFERRGRRQVLGSYEKKL